ncbi:PREDICTED: putative F-box protein At1g33020 [Camelina sativa]|uniref:F-box protein At1g33020 n=1 Tax=Camelina sativa TaxID=90675 RepID=A0ABM0X550_CAMSA|nr:PREDICTED: putative F-box protein At1g33020 [Camelina sativa]
MNRGENLDSIPIDLVLEIFSRLSAKSVGRCCCVSKLWRSTLVRPYFTELFLTKSTDHPRLLFRVRRKDEWLFFSSPQPDHNNLYEKSSSLVIAAADFHMKFSKDISQYNCSYVSSLIYFPNIRIQKEGTAPLRVICNPITGQYSILQLVTYKEIRSLLGFDPIDKQFKVLRMSHGCVHHVLTLGTRKMKWRKIQCPLAHSEPIGKEICVNGVLCYFAEPIDGTPSLLIVCFDVRSEKFKFIDAKCFYDKLPELINYKGKLGGIIWNWNWKCEYTGQRHTNLCMWVLEPAEKQEWSKYVYTLPKDQLCDSYYFSVAGVTGKGDIVFLGTITSTPFYVFYLNPERNILQRVAILGNHEVFTQRDPVYAFVDHVEDLSFNIMKKTYVATSISPPPEQKPNPTSTEALSRKVHHHVRTIAHRLQDRPSFESINKFNALHLLDDDDEFTTAPPRQSRRLFESISKFEAKCPLEVDEVTVVKTYECDTSHLRNQVFMVKSEPWLKLSLYYSSISSDQFNRRESC